MVEVTMRSTKMIIFGMGFILTLSALYLPAKNLIFDGDFSSEKIVPANVWFKFFGKNEWFTQGDPENACWKIEHDDDGDPYARLCETGLPRSLIQVIRNPALKGIQTLCFQARGSGEVPAMTPRIDVDVRGYNEDNIGIYKLFAEPRLQGGDRLYSENLYNGTYVAMLDASWKTNALEIDCGEGYPLIVVCFRSSLRKSGDTADIDDVRVGGMNAMWHYIADVPVGPGEKADISLMTAGAFSRFLNAGDEDARLAVSNGVVRDTEYNLPICLFGEACAKSSMLWDDKAEVGQRFTSIPEKANEKPFGVSFHGAYLFASSMTQRQGRLSFEMSPPEIDKSAPTDPLVDSEYNIVQNGSFNEAIKGRMFWSGSLSNQWWSHVHRAPDGPGWLQAEENGNRYARLVRDQYGYPYYLVQVIEKPSWEGTYYLRFKSRRRGPLTKGGNQVLWLEVRGLKEEETDFDTLNDARSNSIGTPISEGNIPRGVYCAALGEAWRENSVKISCADKYPRLVVVIQGRPQPFAFIDIDDVSLVPEKEDMTANE